MMNGFLIDFVAIFNMFLSVIIILWNLYFYIKVPEIERWTKLLYVFVGLSWFIRYIFYFCNLYPFGGEHINPIMLIILTFTLVSLAVGSIIRVGRLFKAQYMMNDFIKRINRNE